MCCIGEHLNELHELQKVYQLLELNQFIKKNQTGTYRDIAKALYLNKNQVAALMETLKLLGAEIKFDRILNSYYYVNDFDIQLNIKK